MFIRKLVKKQLTLSIVTIIVSAVVLLSSSYALFELAFVDEDNTQSINVGDLIISLANGSGDILSDSDAINLEDLIPLTEEEATSEDKTDNLYVFSIKNTGSLAYSYTVRLVDNSSYTSNLLSHNYIRYKLNSFDNQTLGSRQNDIIYTYTISPGETHNFKLRVWVPLDEEYKLPNSAIGQEVHLNILIEATATDVVPPDGWDDAESGTLLAGIKANYPETSGLYRSPGQSVSIASEAYLASTEDDYGTSYYFRGAVENNYVVFAKMCWRIVRITGDGSIKMTLYNYNSDKDNTENPCSVEGTSLAFARYDGTTYTSAFNPSRSYNAYVGFMYGTANSSTYSAEHANKTDSTILTNLKKWYDNNFDATEQSMLADTIWCNDKRLSSGNGYSTQGSYYGAYGRLYTASTASPSLKCGTSKDTNKISKFTALDTDYGNGMLKSAQDDGTIKYYKIGLLTADEVAFAGGKYNTVNTTYYLLKNASSDTWWLLSPFSYGSSSAGVWYVRNTNGSLYYNYAQNSHAVRPAIALNSNVKISKGNGTASNPFVINES